MVRHDTMDVESEGSIKIIKKNVEEINEINEIVPQVEQQYLEPVLEPEPLEEQSVEQIIYHNEPIIDKLKQNVPEFEVELKPEEPTADEDDDDIEVLIDLDNDFCEIVDTQKNNINANMCGEDTSQNDEEIVILDLDSNKTIIKNSHKEVLMPSNNTPSTTTSSYLGSNSKLIFVNSTNSLDIRQFQVHMVTPITTSQPPLPQARASNSEIIITKVPDSKQLRKK